MSNNYKGTTYRNFTPHEFVLFGEDNEVLLRAESEGFIRAEERVHSRKVVNGIRETVKEYLPVTAKDFPQDFDPAKQVLIVSVITLMAILADDCQSVKAPDTGPNSAVRDGAGNIIGARVSKQVYRRGWRVTNQQMVVNWHKGKGCTLTNEAKEVMPWGDDFQQVINYCIAVGYSKQVEYSLTSDIGQAVMEYDGEAT